MVAVKQPAVKAGLAPRNLNRSEVHRGHDTRKRSTSVHVEG
jgi:hypothetical protein